MKNTCRICKCQVQHGTATAHPDQYHLKHLPLCLSNDNCLPQCHALPWFNLTEPHHAHTHLMMDCDLTQSRHCHTGQCRTVSDLAISNISGHLWTGRDSALTACALHSATFSSTYF